MADRNAKGRQASGVRNGAYTKPNRVRKGSSNGRAKLTEEDVIVIRKRYSGGAETIKTLAAEYGVAWSIIDRVVKHQLWTHVADGDLAGAKKSAVNMAAKEDKS